jgi:hypothetical protein
MLTAVRIISEPLGNFLAFEESIKVTDYLQIEVEG